MENKYLVTILILAYNHENYIAQTIESVLNQNTSFNYKLLITEDASTDSTRSIVQKYMSKNPTKVFAMFNERNLGLNETLKRVIQFLDTKYTCILGGDDYWIDNNKLQMQIEALEGGERVSYVHTGFKILNESTNTISSGVNSWKWNMPSDRKKRLMSFLNHDFTSYPCSSTCCFITAPFVKCYNNHPELLDYTVGEGTLLHVAMCMYGENYLFIPKETIVYRKRQNSLSHYQDKLKRIEYYMGYINLKIAAFKMFDIDEDDFYFVIKNDLNDNFKIAYRDKTLTHFANLVKKIDINDKKKCFYEITLLNKAISLSFYWYLRFRGRMKSLLK